MKTLQFTGERVVPRGTPANILHEHEQRYNFAAQFVRGKIVLDIASGSGMGSEFLLRSGATKVIGVDISEESLDFASAQYPKIDFVWGDASSHIPLPDRAVDVVVSFETIEHFRDQTTFLEECRRVLKEGGQFICSSPNREISKWVPATGFHVRELQPPEFVRMMQSFFPSMSTDPRTAGTFAQREVFYPKWVARALARKGAERLGLKSILKRLLNVQPEPIAPGDHFLHRPHGITRYRRKRFHRPMFLIWVGQNGLSRIEPSESGPSPMAPKP